MGRCLEESGVAFLKKRSQERARIIAIGNLKGGTGKSTLAINIASALVTNGVPTVVVDTDPQRTSTIWSEGRDLPARVAEFPLRDLASAGEWIEEIDGIGRRCRRVIVDLPAVVSPALASAFLLADLILIPSSVSEVDAEATRRTLKHIALARREREANPPKLLIVPTQVRRGWFNDGGVKAQLESLGEPLAPPIRYDKAFSTAFKTRRWIGAAAEGSPGHRDIMGLVGHLEEILADSKPDAAAGTEPDTATVRPKDKAAASADPGTAEALAGAGRRRFAGSF